MGNFLLSRGWMNLPSSVQCFRLAQVWEGLFPLCCLLARLESCERQRRETSGGGPRGPAEGGRSPGFVQPGPGCQERLRGRGQCCQSSSGFDPGCVPRVWVRVSPLTASGHSGSRQRAGRKYRTSVGTRSTEDPLPRWRPTSPPGRRVTLGVK